MLMTAAAAVMAFFSLILMIVMMMAAAVMAFFSLTLVIVMVVTAAVMLFCTLILVIVVMTAAAVMLLFLAGAVTVRMDVTVGFFLGSGSPHILNADQESQSFARERMIAVHHYSVFLDFLDHHTYAAAGGISLKDIAYFHREIAEHGAVNFRDQVGIGDAVGISRVQGHGKAVTLFMAIYGLFQTTHQLAAAYQALYRMLGIGTPYHFACFIGHSKGNSCHNIA